MQTKFTEEMNTGAFSANMNCALGEIIDYLPNPRCGCAAGQQMKQVVASFLVARVEWVHFCPNFL
jgi:hypothetical protein